VHGVVADEVVRLLGHRVDRHRVLERARQVRVLRGLVGHRRDDDHPSPVGGVDRLLRLPRVVDRAERLLHDVRAAVEREQHARGEPAAVGDERVAHPHGDEPAAGAVAHVARAVLRGGRVLGLARAVAVLHGVEGVVVAVEEVPAGDVVHPAVVVVVHAVVPARIEDQVLGIRDAVAVAVGDRTEVGDVEVPVVVAVTGADGRPARRLGLAEVHVRLRREVGHRAGVAPLDAGVEHRDADVVLAPGQTPREVDRRALLAAQVLRRVGEGRVALRRALVVGPVVLRRQRRRLVGRPVPEVLAVEPVPGRRRGIRGEAGEAHRCDRRPGGEHHDQLPHHYPRARFDLLRRSGFADPALIPRAAPPGGCAATRCASDSSESLPSTSS